MRTLAKHLCLLLQVDPNVLEEFEESSVSSFSDAEHVVTKELEEERKRDAARRKKRRLMLITGAAVGGGVILGR